MSEYLIETVDDIVDGHKKIVLSGGGHWCVVLTEANYDPLVTELEAKARELWPHKFEAYKLPDPKFVKVEMIGNKPYELKHFDDGSTAWVEQVLELNEVIKLDKELRRQQIPLNSKKHG